MSGWSGRPATIRAAGQPPLVFGPPINDAKTAKNRVHLDLASSSAEHQSEVVARIEALGGRRVDIGQGDVTWFVMADPEDNELCVVSHAGSVGRIRPPFAGISPVAAVVFDCADPERIALLVGGHRMADPRPRRRRCVAP